MAATEMGNDCTMNGCFSRCVDRIVPATASLQPRKEPIAKRRWRSYLPRFHNTSMRYLTGCADHHCHGKIDGVQISLRRNGARWLFGRGPLNRGCFVLDDRIHHFLKAQILRQLLTHIEADRIAVEHD